MWTVQFYLLSVAVQLYRITQETRMQANASECKLSELACLPQQLFSRTTRIWGRENACHSRLHRHDSGVL